MSATLVRCFVVNTTSELIVPGSNINGTNLFELGNTFNITVLKLIGKTIEHLEERFRTTFENMESSFRTSIENVNGSFSKIEDNFNNKLCELNPCSQWSKWAKCSAHRVSSFGAQTRTRTCWRGNSKPCSNDGEEAIENESRVCEGYCPQNYTLTANKYCMFLGSTNVNQSTAEKCCQDDGGHLINIDTEERKTDYVVLNSGRVVTWIDGVRTSRGGKWAYQTGQDPDDNGVINWYTNEPSNGVSDLCKAVAVYSGKCRWHDLTCSARYGFVCEVRSSI